MRKSHALRSIIFITLGLTLAGCGENPAGPSASAGVRLHGVALGSGATASTRGSVSAMSDHPGGVTVTVEGTTIRTTISANGTFELEGLPAGTFTLVFTSGGSVIGTVTVTGVPEGVEVNVVVQVKVAVVILVKLEIGGENEGEGGDKTCAVNGGKVGQGIELEGHVASASGSTFTMQVNGNRASALVSVNAAGASFKCNGPKSSDNDKDKKGNDDGETTCDASRLSSGAKIHVRGTLASCSTTAAAVTATEVKIQKGGGD